MAANTISILITAKDDATKVLQALGGEMDDASKKTGGFKDSLSRIKDVALGVYLPQLAGKIFDVGRTAIESAASFEQWRMSFETMLGSGDKARNLMVDISKFAKETPFELPEVVAGTKQLLAFGISQEDLLPTMRKLGDLASGLGVPVGQLTNVFGQVKVAGRLMGQDLLQFTNAGVPLIEALATTMKQPQSEIRKLVEQGKVGFPEVQRALDSLTGEGSKFGGMMEKQSQTFGGVVSNIKDGFGQILRSSVGLTEAGDVIEGSLFDRLKAVAQDALPAVQQAAENAGPAMGRLLDKLGDVAEKAKKVGSAVADYLEPKFVAVWHTLEEKLVPSLKRLWREVIEPMIPVLGVTFVAALGLLVDGLNLLLQVITPVINFMVDNKEAVLIFVGTFAALKAAMMFDDVKTKFLGNMGEMMGSIASADGSVKGLFDNIKGGAVMGNIAVAGAMADIALVMAAVQSVMGAIDAMNNARKSTESLQKNNKETIANLQALTKAPNSPEVQERARKALSGLFGQNSGGGSWAEGGFTGQGPANAVAGIVHKGEYVIPKGQVDQSTGRPRISGGVTIENLNVNNMVDIGLVVRQIGWKLATA